MKKLWILVPSAVATLAAGCFSPPGKATTDGSVICNVPQQGGTGF